MSLSIEYMLNQIEQKAQPMKPEVLCLLIEEVVAGYDGKLFIKKEDEVEAYVGGGKSQEILIFLKKPKRVIARFKIAIKRCPYGAITTLSEKEIEEKIENGLQRVIEDLNRT